MKLDKQKIILLHPGKTGGTSIEHTLRDLYIPDIKLIAKKQILILCLDLIENVRCICNMLTYNYTMI